MIEIKIKGPNAQKRTVIESLRCQFIKQRDKLYMMRFKSLPHHRGSQRNSFRIDIPSVSKIISDQINSKSFQNPIKNKDHILLRNSLNSNQVNQIEPQMLLKFYQDDQSPKHHIISKTKRVKSTTSVYEQFEDKQKLYKTIQDQSIARSRHSSLRDYINNFVNLKESYEKKDKQAVEQITTLNGEKIHPYRRPKNFRSNAYIRKDEDQQNKIQDLRKGQLSPSICRIDRLQSQKLKGNKNILKRVKRQKSIQKSLLVNRIDERDSIPFINQKTEKVHILSKLQKTDKVSTKTLFKNSIGPWRSNQVSLNHQFKSDLLKVFLSS